MRRLLIIQRISATFLTTAATATTAASFYWKNLFLFLLLLLLLLRSCEMKERLYRMMMQTGERGKCKFTSSTADE